MVSAYTDIFSKLNDYMGIGAVMVFYVAALGLFLHAAGRKKNIAAYLWYALLFGISMFNPVSVYVLSKLDVLGDFERFIWLLLPPVVISTGALLLYEKEKKLYYLLVLFLLFSGVKIFNDTEFEKAQNIYKISQEAIEISDIIMRDAQGLSADAEVVPNQPMEIDECPKAAVTDPLCEEIRMYNANIRLWFVREGFGDSYQKKYKKVTNMLSRNNTEIPVRALTKRMKKRGFTYVVLGDWQTLTGNVEKYQLDLVGEYGKYRVLKYTPKNTFRVEQYADVEGYQCMSYVIHSAEGKVIVVDGGRAWQSLTLVDKIKEYGGYVDAWIITHPHDDHMGVLASVLEAEWDRSEIGIGQIYMGEFDYDAVDAQGLRTDAVHYLLGNLEKRENVTTLHAGDEIDVCGLTMKVLHTCNETITANSKNILNDGSMVFVLKGKKRSMLFLGDIADNNENLRAEENITDDKIGQGSSMGRLIADEILAAYPEDVDCTYVQMAHHGNSLLPDYFYEAVAPKKAFFDAPDWLMENRNKDSGMPSYYTTPHYCDLMKKLGAKIISYSNEKAVIIY